MMAAKRKAESTYFCEACGIGFDYKSKFSRHLESGSHKMYVESLTIMPESDSLQGQPPELQTLEDLLPASIDDTPDIMAEANESSDDGMVDEDSLGGSARQDDSDTDSTSSVFDIDTIEDMLTAEGDDYYPFTSKFQALAFMLVNSPRPLGETNLHFVLYMFRQLTSCASSLSSIKSLTLPGFMHPQKYYTQEGVPFYVNSIKNIIRMCIGTPDIAQMLTRYPVSPKEEMREMYHGARWMNDPRFFVPMISSSFGQVYVGDFVLFSDTGVPKIARVKQFFCQEGYKCVFVRIQPLHHEREDAYTVMPSIIIEESAIISLVAAPSKVLKWDERKSSLIHLSHEEYQSFVKPHRLKAIASGRTVVMLPIILYTDDTSGNKSKQWNKFDAWCVKLAGLPKKENSKLHNIHFVCCSNKVSVMDMCAPLASELQELEAIGINAYDAALQETVLVVAPVMCAICDNPRHSEIMNHLGPSAIKYCRICMATRGDGLTIVAEMRYKAQTLEVMKKCAELRTEKEKTALGTRFGLRFTTNPLLELDIDLHRSTPVETLHTILLGPYKYLLRALMSRLTTRQRSEVQALVASFNFSGFRVKINTTLCNHFRSFVGRDFKALAQCALFVFRDYFSPEEKRVWLALSKVFKIAYCDYFSLKERDECKAICQSFVQEVASFFPDLKTKVKIHLLLHLVDNMVDFGPTSAFNTERCETFNSLIRTRNIFGNKQAPSRDIAHGFAVLEHLRFVCSGGPLTMDGRERAGKDLVKLYQSAEVQKFLNGISTKELQPERGIFQHGSLRKVSKRSLKFKDLKVNLDDYGTLTIAEIKKAQKMTVLCSSVSAETVVLTCGAVVGKGGDMIKVGHYLQYCVPTPSHNENEIGLLVACFQVKESWHGISECYCMIRPLQYMDALGQPILNEYDCPILSITNLLYCIPSHCVSHAVSIVHECTHTCMFVTSSASKRIEHEHVQLSFPSFKHDWSNKMYCLNVYCIDV